MLTVKYTPNPPIKIKASFGSVQTEHISKLVPKVDNVPKKFKIPKKVILYIFLSEYSWKILKQKIIFPLPREAYWIYSIA